MCALFAIHGYFSVRREVAMFEADVTRDQRTLARALAIAATDLWQSRGERAALEFAADADERYAKTHVRWLPPDRVGDPEFGPHVAPGVLATLLAGKPVVHIEHQGLGDGRVFTYQPVIVDGGVVGALELSESLAEERRHIRAGIWRAIGTGGLMAAVCGLLTAILGDKFVGRPVRALIDKAQRVVVGDFSRPLDLRQRDEIGELGQEMNRMAERLADAQHRLAEETEARIAALEQLRHAERLSTIGTLASGLAHELGTPLNVAGGRAKLIATRRATGDEVFDSAHIIIEQTARMAAIIRQLLDFARRRSPQRTPVDLVATTRQTLDLLTPLAHRRGVSLQLDGTPTTTTLRVDRNQIEQALANLVMNAVQASPEGATVTVQLDRYRPAPRRPEATGDRRVFAVVSVEDQGPGIAVELLPHIFEPFFTTKAVGEGTGLGLSVAYGIVREHDGWIDVSSTPSQGSRFDLYLPEEVA
jgi:signal transduction histidine kinase